MTGAQFAKFVGVRYSTLMYWLQKRREAARQNNAIASASQGHPRWLEARVEGEAGNSENVLVEVEGGMRVLVSNRTQAALAGESSPGDGKPAGVRGGGLRGTFCGPPRFFCAHWIFRLLFAHQEQKKPPTSLEATLNHVGISSNVAAKIPHQIPAPFSNCRRLRLATAGDDEGHTVARFFIFS
jgi:hypothetical protein